MRRLQTPARFLDRNGNLIKSGKCHGLMGLTFDLVPHEEFRIYVRGSSLRKSLGLEVYEDCGYKIESQPVSSWQSFILTWYPCSETTAIPRSEFSSS